VKFHDNGGSVCHSLKYMPFSLGTQGEKGSLPISNSGSGCYTSDGSP
jgi:hypothetical protein